MKYNNVKQGKKKEILHQISKRKN